MLVTTQNPDILPVLGDCMKLEDKKINGFIASATYLNGFMGEDWRDMPTFPLTQTDVGFIFDVSPLYVRKCCKMIVELMR